MEGAWESMLTPCTWDPSQPVACLKKENLFEWHFAIRGPPDTEFEGGVYHGRILLPPEYPFKPPSFMFLTPNGRFETQKKVCLSISNHHPEHWQPTWGVRTALVALIAFLPTPAEGALGSLEYTKEEREKLAQQSRSHFPTYGNEERQVVTRRVHELMLSKEEDAGSCVQETECSEGREKQLPPEADGMTSGGSETAPHHKDRTTSCNQSPSKEEDLVLEEVEHEKDEAQDGRREMHEDDRGNAGPASEITSTSTQDQSTGSTAEFHGQENKDEEDQHTTWLDGNEQEEIEPLPETPTTSVRQAESMLLSHARELDDRSLRSITIAVAVALLAVITKKLLKAMHEVSLQP